MSTLYDWAKTLKQHDNFKVRPVSFDGTEGIEFSLPPGWNIGLGGKEWYDETDASVSIDNTDYRLTKEAVTRIAIEVGLTAKYIERTPGPLIASHLNYWASHSPETVFGMLSEPDLCVAVVKKAMPIFRNNEIIDLTFEALMASGVEVEELQDVEVDPTSFHGFDQTISRLVFGEPLSIGVHEWRGGLQVTNSLTARHVTSVAGFLHNTTTDNSLIATHASDAYNRRKGHSLEDVEEWIGTAITKVIEAQGFEMDTLGTLMEEDMHDPKRVMADVFRTYKVPLKVRHTILETLVDNEDETYYGAVQAVSESAKYPELPDTAVTALLMIAGELAHDSSHRCSNCQQVIV